MAIVGFVATLISQDIESLTFAYVLISTLGFTLLYLAKNAVWPSTSPEWMLKLWESIGSGILIAVAMAISTFAASIITTGHVDLHALWVSVVTAVIGYFTKTLPSTTKSPQLK